MSGASYAEGQLHETDDLQDDDPYDLSLTLEDTEDDFNIEDITEDQVKELLADEENRFLLDEDEPLESTSSQINIIERRCNNDKSSVEGKTNDSKAYRNTGNLININCDDEEDEEEEEEEEEESELDDRRHSKFKSERVIKSTDKKLEEKDIPETLEAVVLDPKDSQNGKNQQISRPNTNSNYHNQRGKGRNFIAPSARPFIGNNSLSSMGLLPTPLQSINRIHVNPNFKHLAAQGPRLGNPMEANNFRPMRPRGGGGLHPPRLMGLPRQMGPRSAFDEMFPVGHMMDSNHIESLMTSQSLDYDMEDPSSSHGFLQNHNNPRPPLFNEPFENWSPNQRNIGNHQPWIQHPNRPPMGNFQRIPNIFNPHSNLRGPLIRSFQRSVQMNNSLFGNLPRHPHIPNRLPHLTFFNQPNFPLIHPSMDMSGGPQRMEQPQQQQQQHPVPPNMQRHPIPISLGYSMNAPTVMNQGQKRPQSSTNSTHRSSSHQDNKRLNNLNPIASTSSIKPITGHPFTAQESSSSPQIINKVTSSLGQRVPRPSTSNVNLKNIRPIKTVNSNTSPTQTTTSTNLEIRKAALLKTKAARRFLQKENMNRVGTSIKQVPVVDSITSTTTPVQQKDNANEQTNEDQQPMAVDLDIDDEYKKKLEEQKRLREEIIRKKEERRKQMVAEKMKQTTSTTTPTPTSSIPPSSTSTLTTGQQLRRTTKSTIERTSSPSRDVQENRFNHSPLKRKSDEPFSSIESKSSQLTDIKKVEIKGLAQTTTKTTITKLCTSVGPLEDCVMDVTNSEKKAIVTFKSSQHARVFQQRFQRHLVDLCVIQVSLLW